MVTRKSTATGVLTGLRFVRLTAQFFALGWIVPALIAALPEVLK